jgi:tRNA(fMet)-specific endonuclease VapC
VTRYLLDTNIVSDLVRHPRGRVAAHIIRVGTTNVCISIIVAAELRFGAAKRGSAILTARIDAILRTLTVLKLEPPADQIFAEMRNGLERAGTTIGALDMLIAAHALTMDCTVVTDNEREFSRVAGLRVENWLRA